MRPPDSFGKRHNSIDRLSVEIVGTVLVAGTVHVVYHPQTMIQDHSFLSVCSTLPTKLLIS
jgi:hypothetical protein